ncbi:endoglucanase e [Fusarium longipes]|uniref:Endoglucanase e n=1 Tax=Fusarium longipes TaxID=694270 RepID=A0A395T2U2_9HYPO|nr:endoglucanase e [Fusarium longipes]
MSFVFTGRKLTILPIKYQSQDIDSTDWVTLLTICLAPLIAHIVAGVPSPVYLHQSRPRWHEQMCHYNPTSILWRHFAIAERRIRARSWDKYDLAPTNAIFWTNRGWDGSEEMIARSAPYCFHFPDSTRISLFSKEMITTLIVTSQGIQAVYLVMGGLDKNGNPAFVKWMAVDTVFFPLAMIGLLRLCSAFWLNDDYGYSTHTSNHSTTPERLAPDSSVDLAELGKTPLLPRTDSNESSSTTLLEPRASHSPPHFEIPSSSWGSKIFRTFFILAVMSLLVLDILYFVRGGRHTATSFVVTLVYLFFLTMTLVIFLPYFWQGKTTSTIIPCITSMAYKVYTCMMFAIIIVAIVISCIETRKTPCGKYTSGSGVEADLRACWDKNNDFVSVRIEFDKNASALVVDQFSIAKKQKFDYVYVNTTDLSDVDFKGTRVYDELVCCVDNSGAELELGHLTANFPSKATMKLAVLNLLITAIAAAKPADYRFVGRVNPATKLLTWPSTGVAFSFKGTEATININQITGASSVDLIIDGKDPIVIPSVLGTSISTPKLPKGTHTVELRKRSEASFGEFSVLGVSTDGELLKTTPPKRKIEIIGDSISVGYGLDGVLPCVDTAALQNNGKTYGAVAARALNADYSVVAWSGKGLIRNYASPSPDNSPTMPTLYTRYGANDKDNSFTFPKSWVPDAVVINLGTNDFSYLNVRDPVNPADLTKALVRLVKNVASHYPKAQFFLVSSPLLNNDYPTTADAQKTTHIRVLKDAMGQLNGIKTHFVDWPTQGAEAGCDYHPNAATHAQGAQLLAASIKAALKW